MRPTVAFGPVRESQATWPARTARDRSEKWHAAECVSEIFARTGVSTLHLACAIGHLVWKAQPLGTFMGEGISP